MADNIIKIPKLNPIQFYELDRLPADPRYNHFPVNEDLYWLSIKNRDAKRPFFQRWQYNDHIEIQIHTSKTFVPTIYLIDRFGTEWKPWFAQSLYTIPGNTISYNGINVQLYTHHFRFTIASAFYIADGFYWLKLSIPIDNISGGSPEDELIYLSDPIMIANKHKDTILIEYKHKTNKYDVVFNQTNAKFSIRVPGVISDYEPVSSDNSYKDQIEKVTLLSSFPSELYKLHIGGKTGIPDQVYNVVNRVLSCSEVKVDGVEIVKDEGAKWETVATPFNPLKWASISVRKRENGNSTLKITKAALKLFTKNSGSYPQYFVHTVSFTDGTNTITLPHGPVIGPAAEANYLNDLLNNFSQFNALTGTFTFNGNDLLYIPGMGEAFHTVSESVVFTKYLSFQKSIGFGFTYLTIDMDMISSTEKLGIVWDVNNNDWLRYTFASATVSEMKAYSSGTMINLPKQVVVFHGDNIGRFSIDDIWSFNGIMPTSLTEMILSNYKSPAFDFSMLETCKTIFTNIKISGELTAVSNINPVYDTLLSVDFRNNKLTQTAVGNILASMVNAASVAAGMVGGTLKLEGQTPPATLLPLMVAMKTALQTTYSWTVTND